MLHTCPDCNSVAVAYDQPASRYHKEVAAKKRELLLTRIGTDLHAMFASQIVLARRQVFGTCLLLPPLFHRQRKIDSPRLRRLLTFSADDFTASMTKVLPTQPPAVEGFTEKTTALVHFLHRYAHTRDPDACAYRQ